MNKKIFSLLLIVIAIFSIASVSAEDNMTFTDDNGLFQANEDVLDYDEYDEPDTYIAGYFDSQSTEIMDSNSINWKVKNVTITDEYGDWDYYLSTFKKNGVEYTVIKVLPTSGVYADVISEKFNPNEYDVYDGIFYKMNNNRIVDIIDVANYEVIDGQYYRFCGLLGPFESSEDNADYCIINDECYKFVGTTGPFVVGFFKKAVKGTDYYIYDGKYYTNDGYPIEDFYTHFYGGSDDEEDYRDAVINGFYLESEDGIYYQAFAARYAISPFNYMKINNEFYKIVKGEGTFSTTETWGDETYDVEKNNEYVLIDGSLYPYKDGKLSDSPINLEKQSTYIIDAPDMSKYYGGSEKFVVTVKSNNNRPISNAEIRININGKEYTRTTDNNGIASMAINLDGGKYDVTTEYDGIKAYSTVTVKPTIVANDFTKIFRNDTQYYGKFTDSQGNLLKNTDVNFNINGVFYTRTTNNQGIARMNINLNPGTYVLTAKNPVNGEMQSVRITVLSSIVENYDLTKYYKNDSQYRIRLLDGQGNPVGAGVSVEFNINGVFYTRYSDANGYVKMNINLNPGTYIITANYNGLMASNTITVKPILFANDISMKFRDGTKFEVKLIDGQGNPFAGQTVTFNINGVFYQRTTDANGIASLNINLMANDYIITSTYNGLNIANNIHIDPDYLYYTIGTNPLDYNKFSFDWYYSPQWESMVRTIYDVYGNDGMEIRDQDVHYGVKYVCWEESTGNSYALNKNGELISVTIRGDDYVEYKTYDYNNNEIIYHNIHLPNYDTEITTQIDGYDVNVHQWRTPSYSEVDILVYDKNGNLMDLYNYDTMILNNGKWYGPYDQEANYYVSVYHKWHMHPNSRTTEVAVKIRPYM